MLVLALAAEATEYGALKCDPPEGTFVVGAKQDFKITFTARQDLPVGSQIRVICPREGGWSKPSLDPSKEGESGDKPNSIKVKLTPLGDMRIKIESEPSGAVALVNRARVGKTPCTTAKIQPWGNEFEGKKRTYETWA